MNRITALIVMLISFVLSACGNFSPRPDPSRFFTLTAIAQPATTATKESSNPGGVSLALEQEERHRAQLRWRAR